MIKNAVKPFLVSMVLALALVNCAALKNGTGVRAEERTVAQTNNHIDYVEFAAEDLNVVKAFYGTAFGWSFQDWGPDYVSFEGGGIDGGFRGGEAPQAGGALVVLYADDLEDAEARVVDAGGVVTERHEFPGGRRFHFRDPADNVLGVWTEVAGTDAVAE